MSKTLADEPYVLLMDEPFAAVDAQTRAELEDLARPGGSHRRPA